MTQGPLKLLPSQWADIWDAEAAAMAIVKPYLDNTIYNILGPIPGVLEILVQECAAAIQDVIKQGKWNFKYIPKVSFELSKDENDGQQIMTYFTWELA